MDSPIPVICPFVDVKRSHLISAVFPSILADISMELPTSIQVECLPFAGTTGLVVDIPFKLKEGAQGEEERNHTHVDPVKQGEHMDNDQDTDGDFEIVGNEEQYGFNEGCSAIGRYSGSLRFEPPPRPPSRAGMVEDFGIHEDDEEMEGTDCVGKNRDSEASQPISSSPGPRLLRPRKRTTGRSWKVRRGAAVSSGRNTIAKRGSVLNVPAPAPRPLSPPFTEAHAAGDDIASGCCVQDKNGLMETNTSLSLDPRSHSTQRPASHHGDSSSSSALLSMSYRFDSSNKENTFRTSSPDVFCRDVINSETPLTAKGDGDIDPILLSAPEVQVLIPSTSAPVPIPPKAPHEGSSDYESENSDSNSDSDDSDSDSDSNPGSNSEVTNEPLLEEKISPKKDSISPSPSRILRETHYVLVKLLEKDCLALINDCLLPAIRPPLTTAKTRSTSLTQTSNKTPPTPNLHSTSVTFQRRLREIISRFRTHLTVWQEALQVAFYSPNPVPSPHFNFSSGGAFTSLPSAPEITLPAPLTLVPSFPLLLGLLTTSSSLSPHYYLPKTPHYSQRKHRKPFSLLPLSRSAIILSQLTLAELTISTYFLEQEMYRCHLVLPETDGFEEVRKTLMKKVAWESDEGVEMAHETCKGCWRGVLGREAEDVIQGWSGQGGRGERGGKMGAGGRPKGKARKVEIGGGGGRGRGGLRGRVVTSTAASPRMRSTTGSNSNHSRNPNHSRTPRPRPHTPSSLRSGGTVGLVVKPSIDVDSEMTGLNLLDDWEKERERKEAVELAREFSRCWEVER